MKFLKILLKSLLLLIVVLAVVSLFLPSKSEVSRSVRIDAPPAEVFPYVNDFRQFNRWSPWFGIDPDTEYEFSGPASGVGAKLEWSSEDPNVGKGSQEIVASVEPERVDTRLEFDGQGDANAAFVLVPKEGGTQVTWQFDVEWGYNPIGRYMGLMMDEMVGKSYEEGLQKLKLLAEGE